MQEAGDLHPITERGVVAGMTCPDCDVHLDLPLLAVHADALMDLMEGLDGTSTYEAAQKLARAMRVDAINEAYDPETTAPEDAPAWVHTLIPLIN